MRTEEKWKSKRRGMDGEEEERTEGKDSEVMRD